MGKEEEEEDLDEPRLELFRMIGTWDEGTRWWVAAEEDRIRR